MKYTEADGYAAVEHAKTLQGCARIVAAFAIAMIWYRQPIGDLGLDLINAEMNQASSDALMFLTGFTAASGMPAEDSWAKLAGCYHE